MVLLPGGFLSRNIDPALGWSTLELEIGERLRWVIFDRPSRFCLSVHICFGSKADITLRINTTAAARFFSPRPKSVTA